MSDDQERDDAYRAIGRYVATFSELVRMMREMVCQYVAKGVTEMHISSLLLGEATAQVIANAFFGMCMRMGDLDDDEQKVASALANEVDATIKTRNDVAHGDWWIGLISLRERKATTMLPASSASSPGGRRGRSR